VAKKGALDWVQGAWATSQHCWRLQFYFPDCSNIIAAHESNFMQPQSSVESVPTA